MDDFTHARNQALASLNQGRVDQAYGYCARMIQFKPRDPDGYFLMGMVEDARNRVGDALAAVEKAIAIAEAAEYLAHYARILTRAKKLSDAAAAAERALTLKPKDALTLDTLGNVFSRLGRHEDAAAVYEKALALQPDHPQFRFNLATSQQFLGRIDDAETNYERIIAKAPGFVKAHAALSSLRTQSPDSNHIARLEKTLSAMSDPRGQIHLRYALAKECEDVGRDDEAFRHLDAANSAHCEALRYSFESDKAIFEALKATYPEQKTDNSLCHSDAPIFIVGMPRTGTTLVDRIVSSHPDVESAGELQTLPLLLKRASGSTSPMVLDKETIEKLAATNLSEIGSKYLDESASHRAGSPRFTDKLPLNFFNVGNIARILPNSKIVCLKRNPMDVVWSNYKHLFATEFSYYNYSYDQEDTARYIALFNDLMEFWEKTLPGRVHFIQYEDLVDSFEHQTRALIDYLDLPWSDQCLRFHENRAAVATPSAVQVRSPVHAGSIRKWKRYAKHLQPAADIIRAAGLPVE